jgi:hypothetical protein
MKNDWDFLYYNRGHFRMRRSIRVLYGWVLCVAFLVFTAVTIMVAVNEPDAFGGVDIAGAVFVDAWILGLAAFCLRKPKKESS